MERGVSEERVEGAVAAVVAAVAVVVGEGAVVVVRCGRMRRRVVWECQGGRVRVAEVV